MTTAARCEASFKALLKAENLLTQKRWSRLQELQLTDMKSFAMSCGFLDQTPENEAFAKQVSEINEDPQNIEQLLDWESETEYDEKDPGPAATVLRAFRDVWWESSQTAKKESNQKHADKEEDTVVKLNDTHRASRRKAFKTKYGELNAELTRPLLEPSHFLEDELHSWVQLDQIARYIGPVDCTNTIQEWHFKQKKEGQTVPKIKSIEDLQKHLAPSKELQATPVPNCAVMFECLQRRGIALELNRLAMYMEHNKWVQVLRDATRHPNEVLPDINDCLKADFAFFRLIREHTRDAGLSIRETNGIFPLHECMNKFREHWEISRALAPKTAYTTPKRGEKRAAPTSEEPKGKSKGSKRRKKAAEAKQKDREKIATLEATVNDKPAGKGKGKRGKKGKAEGSTGNLPKQMIGKGCHAVTTAGDRVCFKYNLSECKFGQNCRNGKHVCAKCFGDHAFKECPKA